jgi:hypothetical protein
MRDGDIVTSARELLGTPAYLSPEQLEHGLADERSDVWALGCVLYEMVAGAPPFGRGGSTTTASILRDEPVFPPHVPDGVVQVISACLRKNSFARVASPRELLSLLRDALEDSKSEHPATIERASSTRRSSARPSPRPSAPPPATMPPRAPSESRISKAPSRPPSAPPPESSSTRSSSILPPRSSGSSRPAWSSGAMRAAVPRGCVKGTAVRAGLSWFADTYGEASVARCIEFASPELKAMLRITDPAFGIMPSGWYETHLIGELLDALERAISPKGAEAFSSRLAEAIARDNVGGIYRSLFRLVASPTLLTANAQRVWRTYMDEGTLTVLLQAPASFEARVRGWAHHNSSVCRLLQPMVEHSLRAVGYAGLTVLRKQCVDRGDTQCVFEGTWEPSG